MFYEKNNLKKDVENMSLFGKKEKKVIANLLKENAKLKKENMQLINLCNEKDSYFLEVIADGLRHGSSLAAKHMADRRSYLNGK